jgi:proteasome lid subunit RPN8/RPN11
MEKSWAIEKQIISYSWLTPRVEGCGFVLKNGQIVVCANVAADPTTEFEISAEDFALYESEMVAIWHSHPDGNRFSPADIRACKASNLPWILYDCKSGIFRYADPTGNAPYLGRDFVYGLNDCFGLVTDWLRREMNFDFPDVDRYEDEPVPSEKVLREFPSLMEKSGLVRVKDIQEGDILFIQTRSPLPNHAAIMVDLERNHILHHLIDKESAIDFYGSYWRNNTHSVWRVNDKR